MNKEFDLFEIMEETRKNRRLLKELNQIRYDFYQDNYILKLEQQKKDEAFDVSDVLFKDYVVDNAAKIHKQLALWEKYDGNINEITEDAWLRKFVYANVSDNEFVINYYQINWPVYNDYKNGLIKLDDKKVLEGDDEEIMVVDLLFFLNTIIANKVFFKEYLLSLDN